MTGILIAGYVLTWAAIPHVLLSKKRPAATLAWVWSILLFPYLGALAYLLLGADRIKRKRLRRAAQAKFSRHGENAAATEKVSNQSPAAASLVRALASINEIPPAIGTDLRLLVDACTFYPALLERIASAKHHVHIEFFVWRADARGREFLDSLVAAARRGVQVRLLVDQVGRFGTGLSFFDPLREAGGQFACFHSMPFRRHSRLLNLRNHRKLQIIDGEVAFVGGMNIGREYAGEDPAIGAWRDLQIEVRGNVVTFLQETFATDWYYATEEKILGAEFYPEALSGEGHLCQVVAGGPDLPREPIPKSLTTLLNFASRRVWIATGYFAPDILLLSALQICAARGIDVRLLVSRKSDHPYIVIVGRSYYEDLLSWGIRVFEYEKGLNHTKAILIDEEWLMVGSANSDNRSMRLNFELNLLAHAPEQARELDAMMREDFAASREVTKHDLAAKTFAVRLGEAALRPFAPLF